MSDQQIINKIISYEQDWKRIAVSFVGSENGKDIVQEMYIKILTYKKNLKNLVYNETDINKYFIYVIIRNLCFGFMNKDKHNLEINEAILSIPEETPNEMDSLFIEVHKEMTSWNPYEKKLFELYLYSGLSYRELANGTHKDAKAISKEFKLSEPSVRNGTGISVNSIFNTIYTCKRKLKNNIKR